MHSKFDPAEISMRSNDSLNVDSIHSGSPRIGSSLTNRSAAAARLGNVPVTSSEIFRHL
jgi:hypothetical protein